MKKTKVVQRKVTATAKAEGFDIEIVATFRPRGIASFEIDEVQRTLRQNLTMAVSKLPFAHIHSHEVKVR